MTYAQVAGTILWGGFVAGAFLWLLQWDVTQLSVSRFRGRFLRATLRVLATSLALTLGGIVNIALIPLAVVGFIMARNVMLWRIGGCRGY